MEETIDHSCKECGRDDLPLHVDYKCPNCSKYSDTIDSTDFGFGLFYIGNLDS